MKTVKSIAIGCDHAGFEYKEAILHYLRQRHIEVSDYGAFSIDSVDYPDFGHQVAIAVQAQKVEFGIVLCGSGTGIAMTVNKHSNVRCALCWTKEIAVLARQHNDANVISIPARFVSEKQAVDMIGAFLQTDFEGGRHASRVDNIDVK
jgi:ribose 5-phosphate isomerase B